MTTTPVSLLKRLRTPCSEADWGRFVELYTPLLLRWARGVGLQSSDADDLIQDVFIKLLHELPKLEYDPARGFRGWLRTVTRNCWLARVRRQSQFPVVGPVEEMPDPAADVPFWETEYRQELCTRALQIMQRDFDEKTWQAFWACVVEGRDSTEVGRALGMKPGAVRAAKLRVRLRLGEELDGLLE